MAGTAMLPKDQKIFSMQELKEKDFSQYKVSKLVNEGKLIKLNKSYYENIEYCGEKSDFYYTEAYAPKGVICTAQCSGVLSSDDIHTGCGGCCHSEGSKSVNYAGLATDECSSLY